jgi:hypothetical protein
MEKIITLCCSTKNVHRKTLNGVSCGASILINLRLAGSCLTLLTEKCRVANEKGLRMTTGGGGAGVRMVTGERDEKGI